MLTLLSSPVLRQYAAVIIGSLTMFHLGMHIVWCSPMLIKFRDPDQTVLSRPLTQDEEAWMVSIHLLSGIIALLTSGTLVSFFGRKRMLLLMFVPRLAMCFLMIYASEVWMILLAKSLGGVADFICFTAMATYSSEVAGKEIRGACGTLGQIILSIGMLIMFGVGPYVSYIAVNAIMTGLVAASIIPILFTPESPYFLYSKGCTQEAVEVLTLLRGSQEAAYNELKEYENIPKSDSKFEAKSLFTDKVLLKTFLLAIFLSFGHMWNGYNAVNYYLQSIFESAKTSISSEISSLIVGMIQLLACCCAFLMTDKFGRKPLLCVSSIGMAIGMVGLGTFFVILENGCEIVGVLNLLPLISIMIMIYSHNIGVGSLIWMFVAELFEGHVRPYGVSCGLLIAGLTAFVLTYTFPAALNVIGPIIMYYIFAGCSVILCVVIYFFLPETKGKSFAEIQIALGRKREVGGKEISML